MTAITVMVDWQALPSPRIQARLVRRADPVWFRAVLLIAPLAAYALGVSITISATDGDFRLAYLWPFLLPILVFLALTIVRRRRLQKMMRMAPIRLGEGRILLDETGFSAPGARIIGGLSWDMVVDVVEDPVGLLLLISPIEYIPLPDAGLPEGMSRADLLARISGWRGA